MGRKRKSTRKSSGSSTTGKEEETVVENKDVTGGDAKTKDAGSEAGGVVGADNEKDGQLLIFNRWPIDVEIRDRGLERYINIKPVGVPHFSGQFTKKRFWKSKYNIVERLANRLMNPGVIKGRIKGRKSAYHSGKKQKVLNIMRRAFELIYLKTGQNPIQLLVKAIENAAPREDTTRISMGGISYQSAVDVAPQRRVDMAIHFLAMGETKKTYNNPLTIEECLANEILAAARNDQSSYAIM
ncbi:MAG: 30S ribosomal protein S7, partial [Promethearchaeota archaeon]